MRQIARKHDVSVATVALGYVLAKPFVMSVIIGASGLEQLEQNLASVKVKLDAEDIAKLDEVSALPSEYPGWMLERQGVGRRPEPFNPKA
jgi:aryl-alcohol dehydrogenase-like predicted oxidoreductase